MCVDEQCVANMSNKLHHAFLSFIVHDNEAYISIIKELRPQRVNLYSLAFMPSQPG